MTEETYKAMKKARAECKRALSALQALLDLYPFDGHTADRCDTARQCCEAAICMMTVDISDYELKARHGST